MEDQTVVFNYASNLNMSNHWISMKSHKENVTVLSATRYPLFCTCYLGQCRKKPGEIIIVVSVKLNPRKLSSTRLRNFLYREKQMHKRKTVLKVVYFY